MSWQPDVTVQLDGEPLEPDRVLGQVTIVRGRHGIDTQPAPGYVTVSLLDLEASMPRTRLDARVSVDVDGVRLVTDADVSDSSVALVHYGTRGRVAQHRLRALGRFARLHRRDQTVELPAQHDGERVAAILEAIAGLPWSSAHTHPPTAASWTEVPDGMSWSDVDPTPTDVDTPGRYQLAALDPSDPWQALQAAVADGLGQLAELRNGGIRYTDAHGRTARAAADGFLELPAEVIAVDGLEVYAAIGDTANRVRVRYVDPTDPDETLEVVVSDPELIDDRGGVLEMAVDTQLVDPTDAEARAQRLLELRRRGSAHLEQLTVALDAIDQELRDRLLALEVGTPIRVRGLPAAVGGPTFTGAVEHLEWTVTRWSAAVTLGVSEWSFSEFAATWEQLDPAAAWETVDPSIAWPNAQELALDA